MMTVARVFSPAGGSVWYVLLATALAGWVAAVVSGTFGLELTWVFRILVVFQFSFALVHLAWSYYLRVDEEPSELHSDRRLDPWAYLLVSVVVCTALGIGAI